MPRATSCFKICPPSATSCLLKRKYGQLRSVYIRASLVYVWCINSPSRALQRRAGGCINSAAYAPVRRMIQGRYTTLILTALTLRRFHLPIRHWRACIPLIRRNCERCFFFPARMYGFPSILHIPYSLQLEIRLICIFGNITRHSRYIHIHTYITIHYISHNKIYSRNAVCFFQSAIVINWQLRFDRKL